LGKFNLGFQAKANPAPSLTAGHVNEILSLCDGTAGYSETPKLCEAIGFEELEGWGAEESAFRLLVASFAHHGRPVPIGQGHRADIWEPRDGLDPFAGMRHLREQAKNWFPLAFSGSGVPFPDTPAFHHAFNGLVTLADWIGSDQRFFPFSMATKGDRFSFSRRQAHEAMACVGLDILESRMTLGSEQPPFDLVSSFSPRPAQMTIMEAPFSSVGNITVLEAETGAGKTEAALIRFLHLFQAGLVDGMYFALPTRTSATQIFGRVRDSMERAFPDPARRPNVILAVPGYIAVDEKHGKALPDFEVLWDDDPNGYWRRRGWAAESPKRFLAGSVVVGTIDQILLAGLMVPHAHLRMTMLLRHLLVVDEVHASDAYMNRLLETVVRLHLKAGGHALLMSATLGSETRERFMSLEGSLRIPAFEEACQRPFPCVTSKVSGGAAVISAVLGTDGGKEITTQFFPFAGDPIEVSRKAFEFAELGARVLVLRNTVVDCVKVQIALEKIAHQANSKELLFQCEGRLAPHHSRFSKEDREILDASLYERFGKGTPAKPCILVATQTVQQSLDLDFDVLITDLCPMDVLLQRVGRVHRHPRDDRPPQFMEAKVVVLVPSGRDLGSFIWKNGEARGPHGIGSVYQDLRILEATWRLLEERGRLVIPAMNRDLVERTTHPQLLAGIVGSLSGPWIAHDTHMKGIRSAHQQVAVINHLKWDVAFGEKDSLFPSEELERRMQTRLGAGDRLIRFESPFAGPFGASVKILTLPSFMVRDAAPDAMPQDVRFDAGETTFTFGKARYRYDRLGLRFFDDATVANESEED